MAKLYFTYGTMNSGKSLELIRTAYNYNEQGLSALVFKPTLDTRYVGTQCKIKSRNGSTLMANRIHKNDNIYEKVKLRLDNGGEVDCIFVDECQFLSIEQIDQLSDIVDYLNIPVMCFGLRTNFQGFLFQGSKRLFELADEIRECRSIDTDGRRAIINARIVNGKVTISGEEVKIGGNESYKPMTRKNFKKSVDSSTSI
jgi:thymidine kinase